MNFETLRNSYVVTVESIYQTKIGNRRGPHVLFFQLEIIETNDIGLFSHELAFKQQFLAGRPGKNVENVGVIANREIFFRVIKACPIVPFLVT